MLCIDDRYQLDAGESDTSAREIPESTGSDDNDVPANAADSFDNDTSSDATDSSSNDVSNDETESSDDANFSSGGALGQAADSPFAFDPYSTDIPSLPEDEPAAQPNESQPNDFSSGKGLGYGLGLGNLAEDIPYSPTAPFSAGMALDNALDHPDAPELPFSSGTGIKEAAGGDIPMPYMPQIQPTKPGPRPEGPSPDLPAPPISANPPAAAAPVVNPSSATPPNTATSSVNPEVDAALKALEAARDQSTISMANMMQQAILYNMAITRVEQDASIGKRAAMARAQ
jgi:hypothetical protein